MESRSGPYLYLFENFFLGKTGDDFGDYLKKTRITLELSQILLNMLKTTEPRGKILFLYPLCSSLQINFITATIFQDVSHFPKSSTSSGIPFLITISIDIMELS